MRERTTYCVQWQIDGKEYWKYYSTWKEDLQEIRRNKKMALESPGSMAVRILKRHETLTVLETTKK